VHERGRLELHRRELVPAVRLRSVERRDADGGRHELHVWRDLRIQDLEARRRPEGRRAALRQSVGHLSCAALAGWEGGLFREREIEQRRSAGRPSYFSSLHSHLGICAFFFFIFMALAVRIHKHTPAA